MRIYHEGKALKIYQKTFIEKNMKSSRNVIKNAKPADRRITTPIITVTTVIN